MVASVTPSLVWSYPFASVFKLFQVVGPKQWTAWVLSFILFRAVSPKQWTTWVYLLLLFQVVSPKQWTTWVYLSFSKSVIPCFVRQRDVTRSFASLSNFIPRFVGIRKIKCHSPVYRNTEYQNHHSPFCRITEYQKSFPGLSDYGISNVIPRFIGIRKVKK